MIHWHVSRYRRRELSYPLFWWERIDYGTAHTAWYFGVLCWFIQFKVWRNM